MRGPLFESPPEAQVRVRAAARAGSVSYAAECRALTKLFDQAEPEHQEFVHGEVACLLHLSPASAGHRLDQALRVTSRPRLLAALEVGLLGVGHALAVLDQIEHLDAAHADAVLEELLGGPDPLAPDAEPLTLTPGELRAAARKAVILRDPAAARARHQQARRTAGVRGRPGIDGMGQIVIDCTAVQMATGLAAIRGRAASMSSGLMAFEDLELTEGQKQVAAFLHALGCERTRVQAVIECPVERAVDLHALAGSAVWTVDVRMPAAVALGLSDHPAVLTGYGPLDADQARAMLPAADLVRACVDAGTGEVLTVDAPIRVATWAQHTPGVHTRLRASTPAWLPRPSRPTPAPGAPDDQDDQDDQGRPDDEGRSPGQGMPRRRRSRSPAVRRIGRALALRQMLITMATAGGSIPDLTTRDYTPSEALGRLVDLRDVTSTFPGDLTPTRRTDRDHRLPWPLGPTSADNLQNAGRRWHRAKHTGWRTHLRPDGTIRWTSPTGHTYDRAPRRTPPPAIGPDTTPPPLDAD